MRGSTQARIGLGQAGAALPTSAVLQLNTALAAARDAVHDGLDLDALLPGLAGVDLGEPITLRSKARDRGEYLRRPDLGRVPADLSPLPTTGWQVGFVIADGLSSKAVD
ncbi:MAG: ethanolamine ammonia-lyase light chain EutC, partial [Propionibacterium sp.]